MNENTAQFVILGEPKAKARPRHTKSGITYTPKETVEYENLVKTSYQYQCKEYFKGSLKVIINCFFKIPESASAKKRQLMIEGKILPAKKPDADNLAKSVCDALNGIAYDDDKQVIDLRVYKRYGEQPKTVVTIREIGGTNV